MQLIGDSGQLPVGWKIKTLDELCHIARGGSPRPIKQFITNDPNGVNWIKISDASSSSRYIYETKEKINPNGIKHSRLVSEGDFILSNSMSFGRPYIMRTSGCIHDEWLVLKDKSGLFDQDYLYYFLVSNTTYKQFDILAAGSTVRNLNIDLVRGVKVILPPLSEQKWIVAILDESFEGIDRAIANTEKNLANAHKLFESVIQTAIFVDCAQDALHIKTVADVVLAKKGSIRTGPFGSQLLHSEFVDEGIAVLGIDNAVENEFKWGKKRFILPEKFRQLSRYQVKPGDVLITIMGTCGRCAIVPNDIPTAINTKHLCCITLDHKQCLPSFLHAYFLHHPIAQRFLTERAKGSIMSGLNMEIIKELPLHLPPISKQQIIIEKVNFLSQQICRLETIYRQKIAALNELKQSILQKAFTSELTADTANQTPKAAQEVNAA